MLKPYERLSRVYDIGWGDFSVQYVDLINELLQERGLGRARILDLACGTGVLAIELAKCGHVVHGIDTSQEMISVAKSKSAGLSNLSFDIQDMVQFEVYGKFDLVTCTFDSINYIRKLSDLRKMLFRVASVLPEGRLFVFDSNTRELYLSHSNEKQKRELNGQTVIQNWSYDSTRSVATTAFSFSDGTYEIHKQRPYNFDELNPLLERVGFRVLYLFSWFEKLPYSSNTPKLFCVAEKHS
jgi:2-polyprenyl-3-methyl-5-hydroxy-6-metoxy-1,4-benzoquinol methylase